MKNLKLKKLFLAAALGLSLSSLAQDGYGEIRGIIKSEENLEPVPYATIKVLQGDHLVGGTQTDENGRYVYKPLPAGIYEMKVMDAAFVTQPVNGISVIPNEAAYVDVKLTPNTLETITITAKPITYMPPGVDRTMYSMVSIDAKDLNVNASYVRGDLSTAVVAMTSDVVQSNDGELHFRGGRGDASANYVDGVKTYQQTSVPGLAIENITVFSGGVPACYGDVMSGLVVVNTKSYFSGLREANMRDREAREKREEEKRLRQAKIDEDDRAKEIEAEKAKERAVKQQNPK